ncbi:MAG: lamin tail domain-containing protein [Flavobacteriaceae bacterium]|nr:lamin tail domain-containing protein [Flavobacteriaceae bacterium]
MKNYQYIIIGLVFTLFSVTSCIKDEIFVGPPSISNVFINPSAPGATDDVTISAKVTDLKDVISVTLYYKLASAGSFTSVTMTEGSGSNYTAVIPQQATGSVITYYIEALNVSDLISTYPTNAPTTTSAYTVGAPAIVINELFSRGVTGDVDWIEIYNSSANSVNISGFKIYDSGGQAGTKPKMEVPSGTTIAAHGYYVFIVDDAAVANPSGSSFGLSSSGEEVWLESAAGFVIDDVTFPAMPVATTSYGRMPDGSATWGIMNNRTKGTANTN